MTDRTNRIAEFRKRAGLSQQDLADKVGSHWITISKLERGKMQLTESWITRLSEALGTEMADLLPKTFNVKKEVEVEGSVRADGSVSVADGERRSVSLVPAEGYDDIVSYWLACEAGAMVPFLDEGDLVRFNNVDKKHFPDGIGRLCHVIAEDGRELVGFLAHGPHGTYSISAPGRKAVGEIRIHAMGIAVEARFLNPGVTEI